MIKKSAAHKVQSMAFDPVSKNKKNTPQNQIFKMRLPLPCSSNAIHMPCVNQATGVAEMRLTTLAKAYYAEMYNLLEREDYACMQGRLSVKLVVHEPDKRQRDINNYTKTLFDTLEKCRVYENDTQIDETYIIRGQIVKGGCVDIEITEIGEHDKRITVSEQNKIIAANEKTNTRIDILKELCTGVPEREINKQVTGRFKRTTVKFT